ncbi:MAG TPA: PBP1A family penicillin-binding protein [Acidimicrobiales bacterium]|nr:PBP1A family penicillin-binding protein [Acidimicrobiales bacterium]
MRRPPPRLLATLVVVVALLSGACSYTPAELTIAEPRLAQSTRIHAADGSLITTLRAEENRENIRLTELPSHVPDAVLAVEDARFWQHNGVDVRAVLRAAAANTAEGQIVEGGSTITQQYVKNTILDSTQTINRKVEEALLAIQLERKYTKERILELYLNTIYFGNGAYGIQAAAMEYFGVPAAELELAQSATLAGLIRAPSAFDPHDNADAAVRRRDNVVRRMRSLDLISESEATAALASPLELATRRAEDRYDAPHFVEQVKRFVLDDPRFGETPGERRSLLFTGGLRITTTLDPTMQAAAEEAVGRVRPPEPGPEAALVSIEAPTGFVRALVGGRDFFGGGEQAKLDLTTGGPGRPAGSSFKPLVLAAALEEGIELDTVYRSPSSIDIPLTNDVWRVRNYEGSGGGRSTLRESTVQSYNTVYAQLIQEVGPADAVAMAARLGVSSPLSAYPSAVLGTNDIHPIDMAAAYATFANRGLRIPPAFVTKVVRSDGTVLYQHQHRQTRVIEQYIADEVNDVLQEVVERGTGVNARIGRPVAGKTGTGQDHTDAWFVGHTPDLATAVWVGFPNGRVPMVPPVTPIRVTGGSWPAQIWQLYTSAALADVPITHFAVPNRPQPDLSEETEAVNPGRELPTVRDVVGMPFEDAVAALTRAGFVVQTREVPNNDYPPGYVAAQVPRGGDRAEGGSTVVIDVSNGEVAVTVPDVFGLEEAEAIHRLQWLGFEIALTREQEPPSPGSEARAGMVWRQSPAAGTTFPRGSRVAISVNPPPPDPPPEEAEEAEEAEENEDGEEP